MNIKKTHFVFLGLTWLFGFLVTIPVDGTSTYARFAFALIFCILNSTQGLHIFIIHILISKRRQQLLKEKILFQIKEMKKSWQEKMESKQKQKKSDSVDGDDEIEQHETTSSNETNSTIIEKEN
jgi:hypothetical protein